MRKLCLLCLALILGPTPAWADSLLVGAVSPFGGGSPIAFYPISPQHTRAVEFSLAAAEYVTNVEVTELLGPAVDPSRLELCLYDAGLITGPTATIIACQVFLGSSSVVVSRIDQLPVNQILAPGTYYLVGGSVGAARWYASDGTITGGAGTALNGYLYYESGGWARADQADTSCWYAGEYQCVAPMFGVYGSDVPVPEPASLLLLGAGLAGLARWRRRRTK